MSAEIRVVEQRERKNAGRTVVAHVSDFHFGCDTSDSEPPWTALLQDFRENAGAIDVIAVTGDVVHGDTLSEDKLNQAFQRAGAYLLRLCEAAHVPHEALFVVPGNHDLRVTGIVWSRKHDRAFHTALGVHFQYALLPKLRLFIYPFNSNETASVLELAAGSVPLNDLTRFAAIVTECQKRPDWKSLTRIALLHHHPMPIAATEHRSLHDLEEFLLLRNAGMFMTEMVHREVDLILHGHKHHPSSSKVFFLDGISPPRAVAVVAAGSVGQSAKRPLGYNLITLYDSGVIDLERRGRSAASYTLEAESTLRPYAEARQLRFARLAAASTRPPGLRLPAGLEPARGRSRRAEAD